MSIESYTLTPVAAPPYGSVCPYYYRVRPGLGSMPVVVTAYRAAVSLAPRLSRKAFLVSWTAASNADLARILASLRASGLGGGPVE